MSFVSYRLFSCGGMRFLSQYSDSKKSERSFLISWTPTLEAAERSETLTITHRPALYVADKYSREYSVLCNTESVIQHDCKGGNF
jgi:hypothetical protein